MIESILGTLFIGAVFYYCYVIMMNGYATDKIDDCQDEISKMLEGTQYKMVELGFYDCSPCEVRYGICLLTDTSAYSTSYSSGLPSRQFLRLLRRVKSGALQWDQVYAICQQRFERANQKKLRRKTI
jgi:hypothetical protein